jgi:hypothetical protein
VIVLGSMTRRVIARLRRRLRLGQVGGAGCVAQSGSALVEFVFLAVMLMVPLFYLVMVLGRLQAGAYGVSAAAREAGRAFVTAPVAAQARARAESAAGLAFADQGFEGAGRLVITCDDPMCQRPDSRVSVTATVSVPMPLVPAFFSEIVPTRVPVIATHVVTVDRFGGQR